MIVDQRMGAGEQAVQRGAVGGIGKIEHHRFLVGVEIAEDRALPSRCGPMLRVGAPPDVRP